MKKTLISISFLMSTVFIFAQATGSTYPVPEYSNEIYLVKKDSTIKLMRLEKGSSQNEMKVKMMGFGGMDQGYSIDGEKSTVRLTNGNGLVFLLFTGKPSSSNNTETDSVMKANGMDPTMMSEAMESVMDPSQTISLYSMQGGNGKRKALTQSMGIMGKSKKTATKYTLSIKKVKAGYYEMIVDKAIIPKGEYTFVMMGMGMDQSYSLFAFGID